MAALFLYLAFAANSQELPKDLAMVNGVPFGSKDLSVSDSAAYETIAAENRKVVELLAREYVGDIVLEHEAKAAATTSDKLREGTHPKNFAPSENEIRRVFDANAETFRDKTYADAHELIRSYLVKQSHEDAEQALIEKLKTKYQASVNSVNIDTANPGAVVAIVDGRNYSFSEFANAKKWQIDDLRNNTYENLTAITQVAVFEKLISAEAASRGILPRELIAKEISDKLQTFTDSERARLGDAFRRLLFEKYKVRILLTEPAQLVQQISVDDDPARGPANAPGTVVMFSDFQCPSCGAIHPILDAVLAEYAGKVRFVVRDFPLTSIHPNAFRAARAAYAADRQGKFFPFTDILYKNQFALDTASLSKYAVKAGLNVKQFELDLASEKSSDEVKKDIADGEKYHVDGTPTVFVNGVKVRRMDADGFRNAIDRAINKN